MGYGALRRRLQKQAVLWSKDTHQWMWFLSGKFFDRCMTTCLRMTGWATRGLKNFLDIRIVENTFLVPKLPREFDGFRILHLSDLHCDLHPPLVDKIVAMLEECRGRYDAAVFTGDYSDIIGEENVEALQLMRRIIEALDKPAYAVLGNHDFIEDVAFLEDAGLRVLLNEAVTLQRGESALCIAGIDDTHFFRSDDLVRACNAIPEGAFSILLSHAAEPHVQAERMGFDVMLCGHTHGGQMCLPGSLALINNARAPRRMIANSWRYKSLQGYTSRGTGACGVAARFFCPPEMTLHVLRSRLNGS